MGNVNETQLVNNPPWHNHWGKGFGGLFKIVLKKYSIDGDIDTM